MGWYCGLKLYSVRNGSVDGLAVVNRDCRANGGSFYESHVNRSLDEREIDFGVIEATGDGVNIGRSVLGSG